MREIGSEPSWRCSQVYPGRPEEVHKARAFLRKALDGCPVADDAVLLASEVAANAVLHSASRRPRGRFILRAEIREGRYVLVEIEDLGGTWTIPAARRDDRWHGLDIVKAVATEWGRDGGPETGWVVWFRLDWPDRQRPAGGYCA